MNIAVIGSKGFIGTHLCKKLSELDVNLFEYDLHNLNICDGHYQIYHEFSQNAIDVVYHLATLTLEQCRNDFVTCINTNITGTANIMHAIGSTKSVKRIVYTSASSVYGTPLMSPTVESEQFNPITTYGVTKVASELLIRSCTEEICKYKNKIDFSHVIFRPSNVYGPGQKNGLIPTVVNNLILNLPITVDGNGKQSRDFIYVDDVVNCLVQAAISPYYPVTINLGSGIGTTINEIINICAELLGKLDVEVNYVPAIVDRKRYIADITLAKDMYRLSPMSITNGLSKTVHHTMNLHKMNL